MGLKPVQFKPYQSTGNRLKAKKGQSYVAKCRYQLFSAFIQYHLHEFLKDKGLICMSLLYFRYTHDLYQGKIKTLAEFGLFWTIF